MTKSKGSVKSFIKTTKTRKIKNVGISVGSKKKRALSSGVVQSFEQNVILCFLTFLNTVKLFHWKTRGYSIHKATDNLYSKLGENIDRFVEVMIGKNRVFFGEKNEKNWRVELTNVSSIPLKDYTNLQDFLDEVESFKEKIMEFENTDFFSVMKNQDLYTIRDEMMADLNQFLYLSTLS